ncbi:MAG: PTS sucrose transporter subunit IIABC [Spirochaeta sp. LUC14_002_19_P3]|nr:MAG: PTS sucrose transporter subunit IIABC [Spirochaeta sp. LUC14_002_19_P3]
MNLKKILTLDSVKVGLTGSTKQEIIEELIDIIVANGRNLSRDVLLKAVMEREKQMSTGMNNGIAIPHGKTDVVTDLHVVIGVSQKPVDFASLDKKPARIFIMTISPKSQTGPHLQFLAEVSRLLGKDEVCRKILEAKSSGDILKIFLEGRA